jgi:AraC-like DNA-binding protein
MNSDENRLFDHLAAAILRHVPGGGAHDTAIPSIRLSCTGAPTTPQFHFAKPAVYFMVQGKKQLTSGGQTLSYGRSNYLVASIDMPVSSCVIEASTEQPCMGIHLAMQPRELAALMLEANLTPPRSASEGPALRVGKVSPPVLDALVRLVDLLDSPADIPVMAPLITREIFFRLLQGDLGGQLAHIALGGGRVMKIAGAIKWLKANFTEPLRIEELAREVNLSQSSLHHQFKAVTGMSPLQFQKALRLEEARRRLLSETTDVTRTGLSVGYESSSQFIREYSRQFGAPPLRDANRLKIELEGQEFSPDS